MLGTRLPIAARFPAADAALALAGGDLSVLGPREARALISDARCIPMIYYLYFACGVGECFPRDDAPC